MSAGGRREPWHLLMSIHLFSWLQEPEMMWVTHTLSVDSLRPLRSAEQVLVGSQKRKLTNQRRRAEGPVFLIPAQHPRHRPHFFLCWYLHYWSTWIFLANNGRHK